MKKATTKKNTQKEIVTQGYATFAIQGVVQSVYNGEMYDYARIRVYANGYYTDYNVACDKSAGIEEGDKITTEGVISVFYNAKRGVYNTNYTANTITEVESLFE